MPNPIVNAEAGSSVRSKINTGFTELAAVQANNYTTNAKLADVATSTMKGRVTAGTGDPEDLTVTQVRTLLNVVDGATANASNAELRDRATHTGTQAASTISDFNAQSRAQAEAMLVAGANVTITPGGSGATRTLTIEASGGGAVASVNGLTGTVVLDADDVGAISASSAPTITATKPTPVDADQLIALNSAAAGAPVLVTVGQLLAPVRADIETILESI